MIETALICGVLAKSLVYGRITEVAQDFGVSEGQLTYIIENESARTKDGDFLPCRDGDQHLTDPKGNPHRSRGIAQINKYSHPEVSDKDAYSLSFALEWTAMKLRDGRCSEWTTCRAFKKKYPLANTS